MSTSEQFVVTVVIEGVGNPFDIVSDFLEDLRVRGNYDVISFVTTPTSGIRAVHNDHTGTYDHDDRGARGEYPTFDELCGLSKP